MHITLFSYLSKNFLKSILVIALIVLSVFIIADFLELLKYINNKNVTIYNLFRITLTRVPFMFQETYHLVLFIAAVYSFFHFSKSNEYVVIKASGVSIWQFMYPYITVSIAIGLFAVTLLNPISASLGDKSRRMKLKAMSNSENPVALSSSGFWFIDRTSNDQKNIIINADKIMIADNHVKLLNPEFVYTNKDYRFQKSINAISAILKDNEWSLKDAQEKLPKQAVISHSEYAIPTDINTEDLKNSFTKPEYISVWDLPYFIDTLKSSGHSAKQYINFLYKIISKPLIATAIVFIAAILALKPARFFKASYIIIGSLLIGFISYFLIEMSFMSIMTSNMNQLLGAVIVIISGNVFAIAMLKYSEDR